MVLLLNVKIEYIPIRFVWAMCLQEEETKSWKKLITIAVSGAAGMISNHLLFKVSVSWI